MILGHGHASQTTGCQWSCSPWASDLVSLVLSRGGRSERADSDTDSSARAFCTCRAVILALYIIMGKRERIREKALGTALGAIAAIPLAIVGLPAWAISVLAAAAFVLALWQYKRYWLYYGFWTLAIILALSPPGKVATEAAHRGSEILVGIGILVVALAIMQVLGTWLSKRYPQP